MMIWLAWGIRRAAVLRSRSSTDPLPGTSRRFLRPFKLPAAVGRLGLSQPDA